MTDRADLIRRLEEEARELDDSGGDYDVTIAALLREAAKALKGGE
jgi:hypothetical protein